MSYKKCGLCLQNLEKECPFFCPEETVRGYQTCIYERVVPDYKVYEGGKQLFCKHAEVPTLRLSRSERNLTSHAEEKKNFSNFNGQMNFLSLLKKKHLPTNQDPSYKDNLVEQMVVDIRLYIK